MTVNLCFHGLGPPPAQEREPGESRYWVPVPTFEGVLDLVMGRPEVGLSFDDGNSTDVELALPRLLERGLTATFFVLAGRTGTPGSLAPDDLAELQAGGMRIGSHGMHHRPWPGLTPAELREELVVAREHLQELTGTPVDQAACPLGRYDRRVLGELRRLGYTWVGTSDRRPAREHGWVQPRYSVRVDDTPASVAAEALGAVPPHRRAALAARGLLKRLR